MTTQAAVLLRRNLGARHLAAIDERRRAAILKSEQAQARRNAASKEIGALMGQKKLPEAEAKKKA